MASSPSLLAEVEKLKGLGVNVGCFSSEGDGRVVVRFGLDTDFLNKFTARQWGIVPKKSVVIQLKFEDTYTAADDIPGVFIFQSSDKRLSEPSLNDYETEFGVVQWFLETRLTEVLRSNWEKRPGSVRTGVANSSPSKAITTSTTTTTSKITNTTTTSTTTVSSTLDRRGSGVDMIPVDDNLVQQLKEVGFPEDKARAALHRFTNDFEMALNHLLTAPDEQSKSATVTETPVSMEIDGDNKNTNPIGTKTPEKGQKRPLSTSDDDSLAKLVGMGFDMGSASEALATHPVGTPLDVIRTFITPKKRKSTGGDEVDSEKLEVLKGLGFSHSEAANALAMAQGDLAKAVELVEGNDHDSHSSIKFIDETQQVRITPGRRGKKAPAKAPAKRPSKKRGANDDDIPIAKNEVNLWTEDSPFLINVYNYISMRFITCPGYCLICDRDLDITTFKLPVCGRAECVRVYGSTACGSNQVITELKEQPAVVELLLNLLCACISSPLLKGWNRNGNVLSTKIDGSDGSGVAANRRYGYAHNQGSTAPQSFEPFPYNLGFDDDGTQNIDLVRETVDAIPPIIELQQCSSDVHLQAYLEETASPLAFPLLRWLLRSSRAHLSLIPTNKQITEMGTPYQFQIVSTNPEHERTFQKWKQQAKEEKPRQKKQTAQQQAMALGLGVAQPQYVPRPGGGFMLKPEDAPTKEEIAANTGSFHAFHGSPVSNWHSIVRTGLRGGHVPGIYMAQAASVSQGYMQSGQAQCSGWKNSAWGCDKNMSCMGMVEVADLCHHQKMLTGASPGGLPAASLAGVVNVAMDYSIVVTRYLFFWPQGLFPGEAPTANNPYVYGYSPFQNVIASKLIKNEFLFLEDEEDEPKGKV